MHAFVVSDCTENVTFAHLSRIISFVVSLAFNTILASQLVVVDITEIKNS